MAELLDRIRHALDLADALGLWDVGASLDRAIVQLTGEGVAMPTLEAIS